MLTASGYVFEWCPTHPKAVAGVYFQHRLVVEQKLGRFLTPHERVHHKNHVRHDNRLENLELAASHSVHMQEHWLGRGSRDQKLIERVRKAASDPNIRLCDLGIPATTVQAICRREGFAWIPGGRKGAAALLTEQSVREALQGRSTLQAAQLLGVNVMTLYNRFSHLLTKRPSPGSLDQYRPEILQLVYRKRYSRAEVGMRFGVSETCVTKSIQRWKAQDAKQGVSDLPELPRNQPWSARRRKERDMAQSPT